MSIKQKAFDYIDQHNEQMLRLWERFVNIESGLDCKENIDSLSDEIAHILQELNFHTRKIPFESAGDMLVAETGDMSKPFIALTGHMDTIFKRGTVAARPFFIKDGKAYGPGVLDMKGGLILLIYALKALLYANTALPPIKIILAGDEEVGHQKSNAVQYIQEEARGARAAFNFETGFLDNGLVVQRKGNYQFMLEVFGKGAHVGNDPENGRNAIKEIAYKVLDIESLTNFSEGNTFNVGLIEGGTVPNATPAYAKITCDLRFSDSKQLPTLKEAISNIAKKTYVDGTLTKLTSIVEAKAMAELPASLDLLAFIKKIAQEENFSIPVAKAVGGVSDSAYFTCQGIPTICSMGVQGGRNHTDEEFAVVDSLFERTKLLIAILAKL